VCWSYDEHISLLCYFEVITFELNSVKFHSCVAQGEVLSQETTHKQDQEEGRGGGGGEGGGEGGSDQGRRRRRRK
jgi:hypothetical protein